MIEFGDFDGHLLHTTNLSYNSFLSMGLLEWNPTGILMNWNAWVVMSSVGIKPIEIVEKKKIIQKLM